MIAAWDSNECLKLAVNDQGSGFHDIPAPASDASPHGRGMLLIEVLATPYDALMMVAAAAKEAKSIQPSAMIKAMEQFSVTKPHTLIANQPVPKVSAKIHALNDFDVFDCEHSHRDRQWD